MSTRCNIVIKDDKNYDPIYVYHHCDGYPEGVGAELKYIIENMYTEAFINRTSIANLLCDYPSHYGPYEMSNDIHGDIDYLYVLEVLPDFKIKYRCIDVPFGVEYNYDTLENCELIEECILTPEDEGDEEDEEDEEQYPTLDEGIDHILEEFSAEDGYSQDDLVDVVQSFYRFMNTPVNK